MSEVKHVFADRHKPGEWVSDADMVAGLYLVQQTMVDVQPDVVTFWHEVAPVEPEPEIVPTPTVITSSSIMEEGMGEDR